MKKTILLILISAGVLVPFCISAQTKGSSPKKQARTSVKPVSSLKTESDTLAYIMGANMVQGLPQYLVALGVAADTAAISAEYRMKIESETNAAKKGSLEKTLKTKMDSANTVTNKNMAFFLEGFKQSIKEKDQAKSLHNSGIAVGDQVKTMAKKFANESLPANEKMDMDIFLAGFLATLQNEKTLVDEPQQMMETMMTKMQANAEMEQAEKMKAQYGDKIASEAKFLEENKSKPGVVTRPSGLQYKIITEGNGAIPKVNEKVKVHYHGTLLDGTVFDSSVDRGEPIEFHVGQLIRGWNEALLLMPQGSKWELYIPYDLAYGEREMAVIKPFSALIFEVELIEVESGDQD